MGTYTNLNIKEAPEGAYWVFQDRHSYPELLTLRKNKDNTLWVLSGVSPYEQGGLTGDFYTRSYDWVMIGPVDEGTPVPNYPVPDYPEDHKISVKKKKALVEQAFGK